MLIGNRKELLKLTSRALTLNCQNEGLTFEKSGLGSIYGG